MDEINEELISDEEAARLAQNFVAWRGGTGYTDDEIHDLIEWAVTTRLNNILLKMAIEGQIGTNIDSGRPVFERSCGEDVSASSAEMCRRMVEAAFSGDSHV